MKIMSFFTAIILIALLTVTVKAQPFSSISNSITVSEASASRAVTWIDFDNDGDLDLFVSNGPSAGQHNFLYENSGAPDFSFSKITSGPQVTDNGRSDGSSWGDFNNDGFADLCVVNWYNDNNFLYENGAAGFSLVTGQPVVSEGGFSETCSWGDFNNDGLLDLLVANSGNGNVTGPKENFLYQNIAGGNFQRFTGGAIASDLYFSRGVNWVDADDDGDLDLFVANESNQVNRLYVNQLSDSGAASFISLDSGEIVSEARSSWSGSWGDYDNDGDLDLFLANWRGQNNALYRNDGGLSFTKIDSGVVVSDGGYSACGGWADYDNDGDLDLYVSNAYGPGNLKNFLYQNQLIESGSADFVKITGNPASEDIGHSFGFAWGDYDADGDLDIFVARTQGENQVNAFYRNENNNGNHWLSLNTVGTVSNKSGIGAKIYLTATIDGQQRRLRRDVEGQSGYCGQNLRVHFGLGSATIIDTLEVHWPSGAVDRWTGLGVDQHLEVIENSNPVGIKGQAMPPKGFRLEQNYPNPFNPTTVIGYSLSVVRFLNLTVYDISGRRVQTLVNAIHLPGNYSVDWNGQDEAGQQVASGLYFYRLSSRAFQQSRRMLLLR